MNKFPLPGFLKKNTPVRKSYEWLFQIPRFLAQRSAKARDFQLAPPILINSFPKSGTHLLEQVVESFPGMVNYGSFIASMPTLTYRERSINVYKDALHKIVPGEIVRAHLFHQPDYESILEEKNCAHVFIYRDLRDVAISEAYYLAEMNRWHKLHPYFKQLNTINEQISLAIMGCQAPGFPYDYPNIAQRFQRYQGWLESKNTLPIKFEELAGDRREETIQKIAHFYFARLPGSAKFADVEALTQKAIANIEPKLSHTFRSGKTGQWRTIYTEEHLRQINGVAEKLLVELGYEEN